MRQITPKEIEVAKRLLQGCSNKEIATDLKISDLTVKGHLRRMFLKFEITDGVKRIKLAVLLYRTYPEWRQ